jgi:hypothetical protein
MKELGIESLRASSRKVGKLYPVLVDKNGDVVDGQHRLEADPDWPKIKLTDICSEKQKLLARIVVNVCRRTVPAREKRKILGDLAKIYLAEGERPGKIAQQIAEMTGMSYTWVMRYLPDRYKARPGLGGPSAALAVDKGKLFIDKSKVTQRVTLNFDDLFSKRTMSRILLKGYVNVNFVNFAFDRKMYDAFKIIGDKFGVTADVLISNALIHTLRQIKTSEPCQNYIATVSVVMRAHSCSDIGQKWSQFAFFDPQSIE